MSKAAWQIATAVAVTWAIAASVIAWINKGQIEQRAEPVSESAELSDLKRRVYVLQLDNEQLLETNNKLFRTLEAKVEKEAPSRCVEGTRIRKIDGALVNVGTC